MTRYVRTYDALNGNECHQVTLRQTFSDAVTYSNDPHTISNNNNIIQRTIQL